MTDETRGPVGRAGADRTGARDGPTRVRAVRGAIQVDRDDPTLISAGTSLLLGEVLRRNDITADDVISVFFTMTPDLVSSFPAAAARDLGMCEVPLLCATEIAVPNSMRRVIRLLAHIETSRPRPAVEHVYLSGAERLRPDLGSQGVTTPSTADERTPGWSS